MRIVRGTQFEEPLEIEVGVDTVYVRSGIEPVDEEDFTGWEYKEKQYSKDNYIRLISEENNENKERLALTEDTILSLLMGGM